ncbi:hypothetical protein GGR34_003713 [Microvirga flocculans]|uniref:Uncharacterized protein n=1 Tax=Microvirga flocculans TaxID=217168 RepID=A0A7W6N9A1_9HYPH|nr:hypothetical protein [Microvirga flocculans]MBB4042028.1 hypothetical protein [Microvirga flocculans]
MITAIKSPATKKKIAIEELLRWAYRDELPKERAGAGRFLPAGFGGAWGGVERYGETLAVVDDGRENRWGLAVDFTAASDPHPDAIRVGEAVKALDGFPLNLPDDWNPIADWPDLGAEGEAAVRRAVERETYIDGNGDRRFKTAISRLVMRHALMNDAPVWEGEKPEIKIVTGANGKPRWFRRVRAVADPGDPELGIMPTYTEVEVDGYNAKRQRPYPDAYRKTYLDPDPAETILSRAEYEVWCDALDLLTIDLEGVLEAHEIVPSARPARPWENGGALARKVLKSGARPAAWLTLLNGRWIDAKPA